MAMVMLFITHCAKRLESALRDFHLAFNAASASNVDPKHVGLQILQIAHDSVIGLKLWNGQEMVKYYEEICIPVCRETS
jgi:hypothetical protein